MRILLVEDEVSLQELLSLNLEIDNYQVRIAKTGIEALKIFKSEHFDLILLDVMLPELNGYEVCERIRLENQQIPILMLTAKDESADKIKGLKLGADDYITKPFNYEELNLRIQNLLKRSIGEGKRALDEYKFGTNRIDFNESRACTATEEFLLTKIESKLLKMMIEREGESLSRQQILHTVWGYEVIPSTRTIDNFILQFRKRFESNPKSPVHFLSVRGVGYKFVK